MSTELFCNKSEALERARRFVRMTFCGGYTIEKWDAVREAWVRGPAMDYHRARAALTEARHVEAMEAMGYAPFDAAGLAGQAHGPLRDRIARTPPP